MASPDIGNVTVGDVYQVQLVQRLFNQTMRTVLHYACEEAPANLSRWLFYATIWDKLKPGTPGRPFTEMQSIQSTDVNYEHGQVQLVHPTRRMYRRFELDEGGTVQEAVLTANTAAFVEKRSDAAGRRGIGGVHVGGIPGARQGEGVFDLPTWAQLQAIGNALVGEVFDDIAGYALVPCLAPYPGLVGVPGTVVASWAYQDIRTMRRRTLHVGE